MDCPSEHWQLRNLVIAKINDSFFIIGVDFPLIFDHLPNYQNMECKLMFMLLSFFMGFCG